MPASNAVISPNLGLYLGLEPLAVPARAVQAGRNFRVKQGVLTNTNIGYEPYTAKNFGNPVVFMDTFLIRGSQQKQLIATTQDLFEYDEDSDTALLLNVRYSTGTVDVAAGTDAAVTAASGTPDWVTAGIKAGDMIHFGHADHRDIFSATWYPIGVVDGATTLHLDGAGPGSLTSSTYTIRRVFAGGIEDLWSSDTFIAPDDGMGGVGEDLWIATNYREYPISWDGLATSVTIHDEIGFHCRLVFVESNMLICANLDMDSGDLLPTSFANSDVGKPFNIGDTASGLSNQFRANDSPYPILVVAHLGDNLCFYSERRLTVAQFVGGDLVYVFRDAASGVGPIATRLLADFGDYHEFIGTDSQYLFDGVTVTQTNAHVWRDILRRRDPTRQHLAFALFDEQAGELIWAVPLNTDAGTGDPDAQAEQAYVECYLEEVGDKTPTPYGHRDFPFLCPGYSAVRSTITWQDLTDTWENLAIRWNESFLFAAFPINLCGDTDGRVWKIATTQTFGGALAPSYVRFGRRACGDGRMRGLLTRVYPFATQFNNTLTVTARLTDHASGPITTLDAKAFDTSLPEEGHFVTHYRRGRYFELQFGTTGVPWQLSGYDTEVRPGGRR